MRLLLRPLHGPPSTFPSATSRSPGAFLPGAFTLPLARPVLPPGSPNPVSTQGSVQGSPPLQGFLGPNTPPLALPTLWFTSRHLSQPDTLLHLNICAGGQWSLLPAQPSPPRQGLRRQGPGLAVLLSGPGRGLSTPGCSVVPPEDISDVFQVLPGPRSLRRRSSAWISLQPPALRMMPQIPPDISAHGPCTPFCNLAAWHSVNRRLLA